MKKPKKKICEVYWKDIRVYNDNGIYAPTEAYTEGLLVKDHKKYILIKNPETVIVSNKKPRNHPKEAAKFYYIPKSLIKSIACYE